MTSVAPSAGTSSAHSGSARLTKALMVLAVLLAGAAAVVLTVGLPSSGSSSAPFHGSAVPPLYRDAQLAAVDGPLKDAGARAPRAPRQWLTAHPAATDESFYNWAVNQIGPPPGDQATR